MKDKQTCIRHLKRLDTSDLDNWLKYKIESVIIELEGYVKYPPELTKRQCLDCAIMFKIYDIKRKFCDDCRDKRKYKVSRKSLMKVNICKLCDGHFNKTRGNICEECKLNSLVK